MLRFVFWPPSPTALHPQSPVRLWVLDRTPQILPFPFSFPPNLTLSILISLFIAVKSVVGSDLAQAFSPSSLQ